MQEVIRSGPARPYGIATLPLTYSPPVINASQLITQVIAAQGVNRSSCVLQAEPARELSNLKMIPVFVLTSEASYHAVYDYCTVDYLRQAGVEVHYLNLPEVGIHVSSVFF
jgi:hypothetical protein